MQICCYSSVKYFARILISLLPKALATILKVCETGEYYMSKDYVHAKSERLYCSVRKDTIINQIYHVAIC
jgi:hypothetical protein